MTLKFDLKLLSTTPHDDVGEHYTTYYYLPFITILSYAGVLYGLHIVFC